MDDDQQHSAPPRERTSPPRPVNVGDSRWWIPPELQAEFFDRQGLRRSDWERDGCVEVIKTGPHREVVRVTLPSGRYYVKHYKIPGLKALLQNLIRPPKSMLEKRMAQVVRAAGIPTFETIGWGETRRGGIVWDNYFVSREISGVMPLDAYLKEQFPQLPGSQQNSVRRAIAVELGRFTARLHRAGILHRDFHAGNILVNIEQQNEIGLWLIDLHCAHVKRSLSPRDVRNNLGQLHQFFATKTTRADRYRFFQAYWTECGFSGPCREAALEAQKACTSWANWQWQRKDRKWRRGTRHLLKWCGSGAKGRGVAMLGKQLLGDICRAPERLFDSATIWHKNSPKRRVAAVRLEGSSETPQQTYWKCLTLRGIKARLSHLFRQTPVRRAWENGHALLRREIATPKPLLYVEATEGWKTRQYLLTESIPDSTTLYDFGQNQLREMPLWEQRQWIERYATQLAVELRRLHAYGFEHRDLKSKNILISNRVEDGRIWFLDLEGVRRWPRIPHARLIQNLSRLHVSSLYLPQITASDRLRFLRRYLGSNFSQSWKATWRKIEQRSRRKIDRNRKTGRPLS